MSVKRKDSKGRILRTGESQRPDGRSHEAQGVIFKHFPAALPALDSAGLDLGL